MVDRHGHDHIQEHASQLAEERQAVSGQAGYGSEVHSLEKDSIVNCDETWCKVRKYDHYKKCYIWVLVNKAEKIAIFFYEDGSRSRGVLTHFLGDAELKSIMTDGYNAYVFIGDELKSARFKDTDHQICMAHAMAKFAKPPIPAVTKPPCHFGTTCSLLQAGGQI